MLSVIICTLNEEHYLPKLLDTIAAQRTNIPFEVIVVDAMSDDGTADAVKSYQEKNPFPLTLYQLERPGLSAQRNFGVGKASFEHLLFLDADVLLPENFIENAMAEIRRHGIRIAGTKIYSAEPGLGFRLTYWLYSATYLPVVRLWNPIVHGCSIFTTKELNAQVGVFKTNITFEDFRYAADAAQFYRPRLLRSAWVRTSARRYYKFDAGAWWELFRSGIHSIFTAGIDGKKNMKRFHENYGRHERPRY